jgi:isoquinoline 1-oxidoreductase alpha subunit
MTATSGERRQPGARPLDDQGRMTLELRVNGQPHRVTARAHHTLLEVLRDQLKLIGTREGCGIGMCGACTVHINGQAARSCITPLAAVEGASVTTIEGLDPKGAHPLQVAWIETQAPQCGYCQSGQIMQAAALLAAKPAPSDADIEAAMNGNLCRCMAYVRIKKAIKLAASRKGAHA